MGPDCKRAGLGAGDADDAAEGGGWADVALRFAAVQAARVLLSFGADVVVLSPPGVRDDLLAVADEVTACYAPSR